MFCSPSCRIPRQPPPLTRPKSIHSYLCQTKSKSFMPFLGRRQLFFSQFYWHAAISVSWSLSKWTPSQLPPSPIPLSPFPAGNVTHFIKLCNARIIAQIRTKRHNRCGAGVKAEEGKAGKSANWKAYFVKKMIASSYPSFCNPTKWKR